MTQPVYFADAEAEYAAGARLRLNTAEWTILSHINEHGAPMEPEDAANFDARPYACARFLVKRHHRDDTQPTQQALMRVYKQIFIVGTESQSAGERARQARQHIPLEEQQGNADRVPGGYIHTIVWNIVPGIRLGDACSAKVFWSLARAEQDLIRDAFQRTLPALRSTGYEPATGTAENLVWDASARKLFVNPLLPGFWFDRDY
ncbi:uncharacterized protein BO72DRAFT_495636 [Aspergillus fijiensis CBS 313.89]|uniref:Uncharacterized protein n=1 Tax=Aspergillus fijiensis CBS 313.89 TaxID=1448319 RepID=A0A8G1RSX3_9EURO|nr:uncharacterized protein BO72DRAFT_495636 [Aspergillus fijiensis CBS 313.89]RAK78102.1 hypothetical protein BO72DRAFT_495636 [Aspergillus fijiensis CBS 313.89]